ncbi:MAG TPA: NUDIX hydrolase [Polyangiaceae bacterium]|jgi:ADP-ribose pyrophosphatase YjhB (NUDIX family)|nr:NUDIX hydrolase [Polyangiaceae bacterium]
MSDRSQPTLVDRGFQLAYVCAYRAMRTYWKVRHPTTHGTLVTLWNAGEVLLVKNSYVPYYSLPGGYIRKDETARRAVVRELTEEVGVIADPDQLELVLERTHEWEGKHDHVQIFSLELGSRPNIAVDNREVVEAAWYTPARALELRLFPPLREVIERRASGAS